GPTQKQGNLYIATLIPENGYAVEDNFIIKGEIKNKYGPIQFKQTEFWDNINRAPTYSFNGNFTDENGNLVPLIQLKKYSGFKHTEPRYNNGFYYGNCIVDDSNNILHIFKSELVSNTQTTSLVNNASYDLRVVTTETYLAKRDSFDGWYSVGDLVGPYRTQITFNNNYLYSPGHRHDLWCIEQIRKDILFHVFGQGSPQALTYKFIEYQNGTEIGTADFGWTYYPEGTTLPCNNTLANSPILNSSTVILPISDINFGIGICYKDKVWMTSGSYSVKESLFNETR